jgi:hypothetical protein
VSLNQKEIVVVRTRFRETKTTSEQYRRKGNNIHFVVKDDGAGDTRDDKRVVSTEIIQGSCDVMEKFKETLGPQ